VIICRGTAKFLFGVTMALLPSGGDIIAAHKLVGLTLLCDVAYLQFEQLEDDSGLYQSLGAEGDIPCR
jgi:hypothetical protein